MAKNYQNIPVTDKKIPLKNKVKRYDFSKKVIAISKPFQLLEKFLTYLSLKKHKGLHKITYTNMEGLKTPYLILGTHMSFLDMPTLVKATYPTKINYVCALDAIYDFSEFLMRHIGIIGKRKFLHDLNMLKNMKFSVTNLKKCAVALYPEARYSLDGTTSYLPPSLGKLIKFLNVPVVFANLHGNYIGQPQWSKHRRIAPLHTHLSLLLDQNQVENLSTEEIQKIVVDAYTYDDLKWQKDNNIIIDHPQRADGLNKLLYQCISCGTEFEMSSSDSVLKCGACSKQWEMTTLGELKDADNKIIHIPDWFDWQNENVKAQIADGTYYFEDEVRVKTMPNAKKFYNQGAGRLVHNLDGFTLECKAYGEDTIEHWPSLTLSGCHIEYMYKDEADAIDLSTNDESYWLYPLNKKDVITKLSLATDELHRLALERANLKK